MILTKTHSEILYKVILQKKKHKEPSITQVQMDSLCNMINVLNSTVLDELEIGNQQLIRYKTLNCIKEAFVPTTITFSGTRKGNDFKSTDYRNYCPIEAGFITGEQAEEVGLNIEKELDKDGNLLNAKVIDFKSQLKASMSSIDPKEFSLFLIPTDFEILQGLLLANMKRDVTEDKFSEWSERLSSFTDYGDKLITDDKKCKPSLTKYFPVLGREQMYVTTEYIADVTEMLEDWFRAALDSALN